MPWIRDYDDKVAGGDKVAEGDKGYRSFSEYVELLSDRKIVDKFLSF